LKIIDSCVHYWQPSLPDRPWSPKGIDLGPPWSVEAILAEAATAGVDQIVQVTPTILGEDNRYSLEGAERHPDRVAGVFGRFDPTQERMPARLDEFAQSPHMLGVRLWLMRDDQIAWLEDGTLDRLLDEATRCKLIVALYAPWRARELGQIVRKHPDALVLADHMTLRFSDDDPFAHWPDVLALRDIPNLWIKASVFPEVARDPFPFTGVLPHVREMYEAFGPDRLIWGANFPPSARACTYAQNVQFFREIPFIPEADKAKILSGTFENVVAQARKI
jgi:predicted TIM-barrel fold metal-dependent hydrolase